MVLRGQIGSMNFTKKFEGSDKSYFSITQINFTVLLRFRDFSVCLLFGVFFSYSFHAASQGLITYRSQMNIDETITKVIDQIKSTNLSYIDAVSYEKLPDTSIEERTTVISYQDDEILARLVGCDQTVALEFPLKILVWEEGQDVYIGFIDPNLTFKKYYMHECNDMVKTLAKTNIKIINNCLRNDNKQ